MQTPKVILVSISKNPYLIVGLSIVVFYLIVGLLAPILAPPTPGSDPLNMPRDLEMLQVSPEATPPTPRHIFGTTYGQYDIYYGCVWGTLTALRVGLLATFGAIAIGLVFGTLCGYFGGFVDEALSWIINIFLALSVILAMFLVLSMSSPIARLDKLTVALILVGWPICANIIRSGIFKIRHRPYGQETQTTQISKVQVWKTYIALILHAACIQLGTAVLFAAAISFVGLGPSRNYADWGNILAGAQAFLTSQQMLVTYWNMYVFPGIFLFTFVLGWILLGEGFQGILEKRALPALNEQD